MGTPMPRRITQCYLPPGRGDIPEDLLFQNQTVHSPSQSSTTRTTDLSSSMAQSVCVCVRVCVSCWETNKQTNKRRCWKHHLAVLCYACAEWSTQRHTHSSNSCTQRTQWTCCWRCCPGDRGTWATAQQDWCDRSYTCPSPTNTHTHNTH